MKSLIYFFKIIFLMIVFTNVNAQDRQDNKLHIIVIGAHPDDAEKAGGTACKWAQMGHDVLLVSLTNGDAGHQTIPAEELAKIRREEARRAGEVIGVRYITLDNHDEYLMPTIENRLEVIKLIREHKADIVITHRTNDYHPDHRYTGVLVLDAAYVVTIPKVLPDVPFLKKNPLFLWMSDRFQHPEPFEADVCIDIDDVIEKKIDMYHEHKSQMYEWGPFPDKEAMARVPASDSARRAWLGERRKPRYDASPYRDKLIELYGEERGSKIKYCEAFQDSGYGTRLTKENMSYYFPFISTNK